MSLATLRTNDFLIVLGHLPQKGGKGGAALVAGQGDFVSWIVHALQYIAVPVRLVAYGRLCADDWRRAEAAGGAMTFSISERSSW